MQNMIQPHQELRPFWWQTKWTWQRSGWETSKMQLGEMQDYWVSVKMYGSRNFFTFSRNDSFFFGGSGGTIKKTLRFFFQESSWINICWEMLNPSNVSEALPLDMAEGHSCRSTVPWRYDGRAGTNPETGHWQYVEQLWKIIQDWWRFRLHLLLDLEIMVQSLLTSGVLIHVYRGCKRLYCNRSVIHLHKSWHYVTENTRRWLYQCFLQQC